MKREPKMNPISTAPKDALVDLWSPTFGWVKNVWWDDDWPEADGWVTVCPRPFLGWRKAKVAA